VLRHTAPFVYTKVMDFNFDENMAWLIGLIAAAVATFGVVYTAFIKHKQSKAANVTCDRCNAVAPEGTKYHIERIPFLICRAYCPKCHARLEEKLFLGLHAISLGIVLFAIVFHLKYPSSIYGTAIVNIFLLLLVVPLLSTVVHEFAHAIVGELCGLTVLGIWIGRGSTFYRKNLLGFDTEFKIIPEGGVTFLTHGFKKEPRFRYILATLAGPAANAIILAIALRFVTWSRFDIKTIMQFIDITTSIQFASIIIFIQVVILIDNLLPHRVHTSRGNLSTDGLLLFQLLTSKSPEFLPSQLGKEAKGDVVQRKLDLDS